MMVIDVLAILFPFLAGLVLGYVLGGIDSGY